MGEETTIERVLFRTLVKAPYCEKIQAENIASTELWLKTDRNWGLGLIV